MGATYYEGSMCNNGYVYSLPYTTAGVLACPVKVLTIGTIDDLENLGGVKEGVGFEVRETNPNIRFIPIM